MGKKEMGMKETKMKKLNNKGFSLVELIVVIAIMAVLAGAMAPQLMKYIEKARESTDISNCDAIKTAVQTALADEDAYNDAVEGDFTFNGPAPATDALGEGDFIEELSTIISEWPKVKAKNAVNFKVTLDGDKNVSVVTIDSDNKEIEY